MLYADFRHKKTVPVNGYGLLFELLKSGSQQLLAQAIEAELATLLAQYQHETVEGLQRIVKNGHHPERTIH